MCGVLIGLSGQTSINSYLQVQFLQRGKCYCAFQVAEEPTCSDVSRYPSVLLHQYKHFLCIHTNLEIKTK